MPTYQFVDTFLKQLRHLYVKFGENQGVKQALYVKT